MGRRAGGSRPSNVASCRSWGGVPLDELDQRDMRHTLAPIWHMKAETERKALNRLAIVVRHGAAMSMGVDLSRSP